LVAVPGKTCSGCTIYAGWCIEISADAFGLSVAVKRFRASRYAPHRSPAVFDGGRVLRRLPSNFSRQVGGFAASSGHSLRSLVRREEITLPDALPARSARPHA